MLVHHRKWRIGEYLVTYTLFVTLLREFLVEIASELDPLDCDCSASENDNALDGVEETAPIERGVPNLRFKNQEPEPRTKNQTTLI